MKAHVIPRNSLLQYGFISVPIAFAGFPLYVLAPDFYATHHGMSLTLLGVLLLALRLFDAVQDPLIGWLTDRMRGNFMPLIAASGGILCMAVFGLFNGMAFSPAIWFALCMAFAVSAYSILTIIMGAQATLWTADRDDQTRISGTREAFGLIGLIIAVSMPLILSHVTKSDHVYLWYGAILTLLMLAGVISFPRLSTHLTLSAPSLAKHKASLLAGFCALPPESLKLFMVYALSMIASSIPAVLVIFFVRDLVGAEHLTGMFLLLYFLSGAACMPLWKKLSTRIGKYRAWGISNVLAVAGFVGAFFLGAGDVWAYGVVCIISGIALGADLTLPPSILADHIHARGNRTFSGTHYACLAFIAKASLALASAIALPVLDAAGFEPKTVNSQEALMTLSITYALIPCVLKLMAAGLLYVFFILFQSGGSNENIHNHGNNRSSYHA